MLRKERRGKNSLKISGLCLTRRLMSMTSGSTIVPEQAGGFIEGRINENIKNGYYCHFDDVMLWMRSHQGNPS